MKKYLKPDMLPLIVLAAGIIGMLLQLWQFVGGTDESGLLISGHISGILLAILTAGVLIMILAGTWNLRQGNKYLYNFPASTQSCVCAWLAAVAVLVTAISCLTTRQDIPTTVCGILGLFAAASLGFQGYGRLRGKQPSFLLSVCVCVFLMVHLICQYRVWSGEPQLQTYCYPLLATVCIMLSSYQDAAFAANYGARRPHAFFHLAAIYFCCLSLIGDHMPLFYFAMGAWMLTDLCRLRPMPRRFARGNDNADPA